MIVCQNAQCGHEWKVDPNSIESYLFHKVSLETNHHTGQNVVAWFCPDKESIPDRLNKIHDLLNKADDPEAADRYEACLGIAIKIAEAARTAHGCYQRYRETLRNMEVVHQILRQSPSCSPALLDIPHRDVLFAARIFTQWYPDQECYLPTDSADFLQFMNTLSRSQEPDSQASSPFNSPRKRVPSPRRFISVR